MPRAPLAERQVGPSALPGARRQSAETFASQGGLVAEAQERFGANRLRETAGMYAELKRAEAESAAALEQLTIRKRFNDLDHLLLQSHDRGLLNKTGKAPLEERDTYVDEWDTTANEIATEIKTEGGRLFYEEEKSRRRDQFVGRADVHAMQQMRGFRGQELDSFLASSKNAAIAAGDPRDPRAAERLADQFKAQNDAIDANAPLLGLGPEQIAAMKAQSKSDTHVGIVNNLIARGRDRDAKGYYEDVADQIQEGAQKAQLVERLDTASTDALAFQTANQIWDTHAPPAEDDRSAIELDKLERLAREQFKDDPEAYKKTVSYLRERKQGVDDARRQRQSDRDSAVWGAVLNNGTASQIRQLPEFKASPGADQIRIMDYLDREAERTASRAAAAEARESAAENRAYTRAARKEQELENAGWSEYYRLSDPKVLPTMTRGQIMALLPTLGRDHTTRLVNDLEAYQKNAETVRTATIDRELFKDVAYSAGLDYIYNTPAQMNEDERARSGRLQTAVETEVAAEQGVKGRRLTYEEQRAVAQRVVDRKVMLDVVGFDRETIAATVRDDERGIAYVPIAQVPKDSASKMANYIRGIPRRGLTFEVSPPSTDDIIKANRARIERAYARALLGASDPEVFAILEGKED
jgi:hypothetical protein